MYVADTWGYRIEKFDKDGKFLLKWGAGKDTTGSVDGNAANPTGFYGPRSIVYDASAKELYITDTGNKRIVVYDTQGNFIRQFGSLGSGQGQFNEPVGLALGPDGNVYVADLRNKRVEVLDKQGKYIKEIAVASWKEAVLSEPYLAFDPSGNLYVSDPANGAIIRFDSTGQPDCDLQYCQRADPAQPDRAGFRPGRHVVHCRCDQKQHRKIQTLKQE